MTVFLSPDGVPFYAGHVLPERGPARDAGVSAGAAGRGGGVARSARRDGRAGAACAAGHLARRGAGAFGGCARRVGAPRRARVAAAVVRSRMGRLRGRAEVPAADDARVPAAVPGSWVGGRGRDAGRDARPHGARRDLRPRRRWVPSVLDGRAMARAALREDALRQRAAGAPVRGTRTRRPATAPSTPRRTRPWLSDHGRCATEQGAFFSSQDADSEGVEGKFFVWPWDELIETVRELTPSAEWTTSPEATRGREMRALPPSGPRWSRGLCGPRPRGTGREPTSYGCRARGRGGGRRGCRSRGLAVPVDGCTRRVLDERRRHRVAPATDDKILARLEWPRDLGAGRVARRPSVRTRSTREGGGRLRPGAPAARGRAVASVVAGRRRPAGRRTSTTTR